MSVNAQLQAFTVYLGEDAYVPITPQTSGSIAGQTFEFTLSDYPGASPVTLTLSTASGGITVVNASTGTMLLNLLKSVQVSSGLAERYYAWDLFRVDSLHRQRDSGGVVLFRKSPNIS